MLNPCAKAQTELPPCVWRVKLEVGTFAILDPRHILTAGCPQFFRLNVICVVDGENADFRVKWQSGAMPI